MRHIKDIFPDKCLSIIDDEYDAFMRRKKKYINNRTNKNYFNLIFAYTQIDADLRSMLSDGYLSMDELQYIRAELKRGV